MAKFKNEFKIPEKLNVKQMKDFEDAAFNTFCVNYVTQVLKDKLFFNIVKNDKSILFEMDMPIINPYVKRQNKKNSEIEGFKPPVKPKPIPFKREDGVK